jgi:hypothetical protein
MSYRGVSNWPPTWTWRSGPTIRRTRGEVGILKEVARGTIHPRERIFLVMQTDANEYLGALLIENPAFCRQLYALLLSCCGRTIKEIGDLDLGHLL